MSAQLSIFAASCEPSGIERAESYREWLCERVLVDKQLGAEIERWRTMAACGWDLVCLVAPDSKTVVAIGCR